MRQLGSVQCHDCGVTLSSSRDSSNSAIFPHGCLRRRVEQLGEMSGSEHLKTPSKTFAAAALTDEVFRNETCS